MGTANLYRFHDGEEKNKKVCDVVIRTKHEWHILRNTNMLVLSRDLLFLFRTSQHGYVVWSRLWPWWWCQRAELTLLMKPNLIAPDQNVSIPGGKMLAINPSQNTLRPPCGLRDKCRVDGMLSDTPGIIRRDGKQSWENIPMDVCFDWTDLCSLSKITLTNNPKTKKLWVC